MCHGMWFPEKFEACVDSDEVSSTEDKLLFLDEDLVSLSHPFLINTRISYVYL